MRSFRTPVVCWTLALASVTSLVACRGSVNCPTPAATVTYEDVAPIFKAKCTGCHATYRNGDSRYGAPDDLNYDTYKVAIEDPRGAADSVIGGGMPYGGVISDHDACVIQAWADQGAQP